MATIGSLNVALSLGTAGFTSGLRGAAKAFQGFASGVREGASNMFAFHNAVQGNIVSVAGAASGVANLGTAAVAAAANWERSEIALTSLTGSAANAKQHLEELAQIAQATPFEMKELVTGTQRLLAFGFSAEESRGMIVKLGDIASAMPDGAADGLQRVIVALGQMRAKGKVSAEEMLSLAAAGLPAWDALAKRIGVEIPKAMKLAEQGQISARDGILAILDIAADPKFAGGMDRLSKSLVGLWSNVKDAGSLALRDLGQVIIETFDLKGSTRQVGEFLGFLRSNIAGLRQPLQAVGAVFQAVRDVARAAVEGVIGKLREWAQLIPTLSQDDIRNGIIDFFEAAVTAADTAITAIKGELRDFVRAVKAVSTEIRALNPFATDPMTASEDALIARHKEFLDKTQGRAIDYRPRKQKLAQARAWSEPVGPPLPEPGRAGVANLFAGLRARFRPAEAVPQGTLDFAKSIAADVALATTGTNALALSAARIAPAFQDAAKKAGEFKLQLDANRAAINDVIEKNRTALEVFNEEFARLFGLIKDGLDFNTLSRGVGGLLEKLKSAAGAISEIKAPPTAFAGSSAALSAVTRSRNQNPNIDPVQALKNLFDQLITFERSKKEQLDKITKFLIGRQLLLEVI